MPIANAVKQRIVELYTVDRHSIRVVSNITGVSQPTVSKIIKAAGVQIRTGNYQSIDLDRVVVNEMYDGGLSTYEIAERLGCSDETVRKMVENMRSRAERNRHDAETRELIRQSSLQLWADESYRQKVSAGSANPACLEARRRSGRKNAKRLVEFVRSDEGRAKISAGVRAKWRDPVYRSKVEAFLITRYDKLLAASQAALADPTRRAKWIEKIRRNNAKRRKLSGWTSSAQRQLYYLLAESGIAYHEEGSETAVGPFYVVDCIIPMQQEMRRALIVEVQGEYWHSLPHVALKDQQKRTYIRRHTDFDLLQLSDLNLASFEATAAELAKFGLRLKQISCRVGDLSIKQISEADAVTFYRIFHYSCTVRSGARTFGAYLGDRLVAAVSYTPPIRTQIAQSLGATLTEVVEISRLARATNLQCRNLVSFLIARTRDLLPDDIKKIVAYSDAAYGHTGTTYAAAGFELDKIVEPDYYYISLLGRFHKKTIWDRAKRLRLTEADYCERHGLVKVMGGSKARWVYSR